MRSQKMSKQFFNLENIMLGGLFLILLIYSGFMISCRPADGSFRSNTFSVDNDDDDDVAVADSRRSDRRDQRPCEDRDSCQDSCDYMFRSSSARSDCYRLSFDDVSELEEVFDRLHASTINLRSLEDIDSDGFEEFLEIDIDGWVDIIVGEEGEGHEGHEPYSRSEAHSALKWIAENDNIARTLYRTDEYSDILYHLFLRLGENVTSSAFSSSSFAPSIDIEWCEYGVSFMTSCDSTPNLRLRGTILPFIKSFVGSDASLQFSRESLISYAYREDNETAVDLAHETLIRFCEDGTDDEFPDDDVQQCMLAAYCSIYNEEQSDNIFDDVLNSYRARKEYCESSVLKDNTNDKLEDVFD